MDRATRLFWLLITLLFGAAATFSVLASRQSLTVVKAEASLDSGDVVDATAVLDGDSLVVTKGDAGRVTVRLLGVQAFDAKAAKDDLSAHGRASLEALRRLTEGRPLRVLLNQPPKDRHGRTLASLYVGSEDVAMELVRQGHAMVYTVHPFAQMSLYLQAQQQARSQRLGLWASPVAADQADALARQWAMARP
jgi:micrococcal nuclease